MRCSGRDVFVDGVIALSWWGSISFGWVVDGDGWWAVGGCVKDYDS